MGDDGGEVSGSTSDTASVSGLFFHVGDNGTFGHAADRQHVSDSQLGLLTAVDELAGVHAFGGDEKLLADLITIRVPEKRKIRVFLTFTKMTIFALIGRKKPAENYRLKPYKLFKE